MKSCVLYIAHKNNKSSNLNYGHLSEQLDKEKYDLVWCAPKKFSKNNNIVWFTYLNLMVKHKHFVNPSVVVEKFYKKHPDYKYYYVIEWDVYYSGNINKLLTELDNNLDSDILGSYVEDYKDRKDWYFFSHTTLKLYLKYVLKCELDDCAAGCMSFARLSNAALNKICRYPIMRWLLIYEIYWPTICKNEGLKINSLNQQGVTKKYHCKYNLMNDKTFNCAVHKTSKDELQKNKFYTEFIWL